MGIYFASIYHSFPCWFCYEEKPNVRLGFEHFAIQDLSDMIYHSTLAVTNVKKYSCLEVTS